jgi:hypothetical protein
VLTWKSCSTQREFLHHGILQASGYHIVTGAALLFWSTIGRPSPVSFVRVTASEAYLSTDISASNQWRYVLFSFFLISELTLILAPTGKPTFILSFLFPSRITHQNILFIHQLFLFFSVALSRVAPLFSPPEDDPRAEKAILEKIQLLASVADREGTHSNIPFRHISELTFTLPPVPASIILHSDLHSITPTPSSHSLHPNGRATIPLMTPLPPNDTALFYKSPSIFNKMRDLVIEHNLKKDSGPLRSAWEQAVQRGRRLSMLSAGAEAGEQFTAASSIGSTLTQGSTSTQSRAKNFWEAADDTAAAAADGNTANTNPSSSSIIDGSAYYVVDDDHAQVHVKTELPSSNAIPEPLPSPRPSPPRSPSPRRPVSPTKKISRELLID